MLVRSTTWLTCLYTLGAVYVSGQGCDDEPRPGSGRGPGHGPGARGPEVESVPSPLHSCEPEPRPQVTAIAAPGAPVTLAVVRARHLCLGEHAALLRLEGVGSGVVTQVTLEREWWSVAAGSQPRRDQQILTWTFERGTVRYLRVKWREGLANRGERVLRVRLARAHLAEGPPYEAGPWPALPPPEAMAHDGLADKLQHVRDGVVDVTRKIRAATEKLEAHPLVRHRPTAERPANERPTAERPANERPAAERPANERPTAERPANERPTPPR